MEPWSSGVCLPLAHPKGSLPSSPYFSGPHCPHMQNGRFEGKESKAVNDVTFPELLLCAMPCAEPSSVRSRLKTSYLSGNGFRTFTLEPDRLYLLTALITNWPCSLGQVTIPSGPQFLKVG